MPHKVLNYLLDHRDQQGYLKETIPALLSASMTGLHNTEAKRLWDQIDNYEPTQFRANKPFIWRTGADSLGHIPPHHMWMILFSSSLLILQKSQAPEPEIRALFQQFTAAAFGEKDAFHQYWSNVRKFRIGNPTPLEIA